jgi:homoserine O-acetyltransferase/O-succinyltransferase
MIPISRVLALLTLVGALGAPAAAYDGLVEKNVFELPSYTTVGGHPIAPVRIGWESYGTLNATKDNAILIAHYFSGNSHAAGKYAPEDKTPGYWDAIIGSGKAVDTDKWFVISSDTLVNLNPNDPKVVTTGPATVDPKTGRPYGLSFPLVTIRDFVNVQKALIESLGIKKLHAVMGASMGARQALEWASVYPDMVDRIVPVVGGGQNAAFQIGWFDAWAQPIMLDPKWNDGNYYGKEPPVDGLALAFKILTLHANYWEWADQAFDSAWAEEGKDPTAALTNQYKIEAALDTIGRTRAKTADANHFLYLVKAIQMDSAATAPKAELAGIKAAVLMIGAKDDILIFPAQMNRTAELIRADGTPVEFIEIDGPRGHLDGITNIHLAGDRIKTFLER